MISISKKLLQRLNLVSFGAAFQLFNAFSTALVAYIFFSKDNVNLWGQFAGIWLFVTWLTLIFNFGNKDFLYKEFSKSKVERVLLCKDNMSSRFPLWLFSSTVILFFLPFEQCLVLIPLLFSSFVTNSFQPLLIFERKFYFLFWLELTAILLQLLFIYMIRIELNIIDLLCSFLIYNLVKMIAISIMYKNYILPQRLVLINLPLLKSLWPFFLLGLGGMLVNKSDFMIVAAYLNDYSKAKYHIISTFSTMGIIAAHAVLQPFIKQIYRINRTVFNNLAFKYFIAGIVLSLLYCIAVYIITHYIFKFQLSLISSVLIYFIELIFFAINPLVFYLFRNEKQQYFIVILLISGMLSLLMAVVLVKSYGMQGALLSNLSGNIIMLLLLWVARRKINKESELMR